MKQRVLGLFRPLARPVLDRLDRGVEAAVERAGVLRRIEAATAALAADRDADAQTRRRLDQIEEHLRGLSAQIAAARQQDRATVAALAEAIGGVTLRLDAAHLQRADRRRTEDAVAGEFGAKMVALHVKMDDAGTRLGTLYGAAEAASVGLGALQAEASRLSRRHWFPAGEDVAVRTDDGYLIVPGDDAAQMAAMVETAGRLEPGALAVACALAAPGGLAVDAGAHVGTFTVPLARRLGAGGLLVAVEPTPRTAAVLRRTLALNGLDERVVLHECAAGAAPGRARFELAAAGSHNSLLPLGAEAAGAIKVAVCPLDALVPAGRPACLVKLDVEGSELAALAGARRLLADSPRAGVIAELGPSHLARAGVAVADWLAAFRAHGLAGWQIDEATGRLLPLGGDIGGLLSVNVLWLRDPPESYPGLRRE